MNNVVPSKKIHSVEEARSVAKKRVPKLMFDFVCLLYTSPSPRDGT